MPTRLLPLLLLFASTFILQGVEGALQGVEDGLQRVQGGGKSAAAKSAASVGIADSPALPASCLEGTLGLVTRTAPANDESPQQPETQYESCLLASDLFVSSSEKFDSSFCESMVLHLVAKTTGKLQLEDLVSKAPRSPSLLRMNVMLQV